MNINVCSPALIHWVKFLYITQYIYSLGLCPRRDVRQNSEQVMIACCNNPRIRHAGKLSLDFTSTDFFIEAAPDKYAE
jgi:hypothetical protein